jgi:7,8-dihydropterin-6-yl-methyl-4-(beta-D-ribofuranosyl)aminobenzene 5'-phosphate synthase
MANLVEIDSLEAIVIVDNELDPLSYIAPNTVQIKGGWADIGLSQKKHHHDRGNAVEIPMESLCCGAHGLSVLLVELPCSMKLLC